MVSLALLFLAGAALGAALATVFWTQGIRRYFQRQAQAARTPEGWLARVRATVPVTRQGRWPEFADDTWLGAWILARLGHSSADYNTIRNDVIQGLHDSLNGVLDTLQSFGVIGLRMGSHVNGPEVYFLDRHDAPPVNAVAIPPAPVR